MRAAALVLVLGAAAAACDQVSTPTALAGTPSIASLITGPSANGQGSLVVGGEVRTFAFHAHVNDDGTVSGSAEIHNRAQDIHTHNDIDCLRVIGNTARMSGPITKSTIPAQVGLHVLFIVTDNGEGAQDPEDVVSLALPGVPPQFCQSNFAILQNPIRNGNVQVKP